MDYQLYWIQFWIPKSLQFLIILLYINLDVYNKLFCHLNLKSKVHLSQLEPQAYQDLLSTLFFFPSLLLSFALDLSTLSLSGSLPAYQSIPFPINFLLFTKMSLCFSRVTFSGCAIWKPSLSATFSFICNYLLLHNYLSSISFQLALYFFTPFQALSLILYLSFFSGRSLPLLSLSLLSTSITFILISSSQINTIMKIQQMFASIAKYFNFLKNRTNINCTRFP